MAEIDIQDLHKEFDTPHGKEVAVDGINLHIEDDEFVTLVGPSGCGKTTTLRCVAGLETPTSGRIILDGADITELPPNKRNIAMMFQSIALYPHMTVRENIAYPLKVDRVPKAEQNGPTEEVAQMMQIEDMLDKHPGDLSGGQQQRAALSRTVVQDPEAFLMDEPLSDLDAKLKLEIRKEIQKIHKQVQKPFIYVTHDQEEAMTMSDRVAVLNHGQIEQIGTPNEIFRYPENTFVGQFIGNHGMNVLNADVVEFTDGHATLALTDTEFDLSFDETRKDPPTEQVTLGFRPENTSLNESSDVGILTGEISLLETFGEETVATIETPKGQINAVVEAMQRFQEGDTITVSIDRDRAHLFDSESGNIVAHTSSESDDIVAHRS